MGIYFPFSGAEKYPCSIKEIPSHFGSLKATNKARVVAAAILLGVTGLGLAVMPFYLAMLIGRFRHKETPTTAQEAKTEGVAASSSIFSPHLFGNPQLRKPLIEERQEEGGRGSPPPPPPPIQQQQQSSPPPPTPPPPSQPSLQLSWGTGASTPWAFPSGGQATGGGPAKATQPPGKKPSGAAAAGGWSGSTTGAASKQKTSAAAGGLRHPVAVAAPKPRTITTAGGGDCAFHALLGTVRPQKGFWGGGGELCVLDNPKNARKTLCDWLDQRYRAGTLPQQVTAVLDDIEQRPTALLATRLRTQAQGKKWKDRDQLWKVYLDSIRQGGEWMFQDELVVMAQCFNKTVVLFQGGWGRAREELGCTITNPDVSEPIGIWFGEGHYERVHPEAMPSREEIAALPAFEGVKAEDEVAASRMKRTRWLKAHARDRYDGDAPAPDYNHDQAFAYPAIWDQLTYPQGLGQEERERRVREFRAQHGLPENTD